jgi:hypothetical protein
MSGHSPSWSDHCGWYEVAYPPFWTGGRGIPRPAPTLAFESPHRAGDQRTFASVVRRGASLPGDLGGERLS